MTTPSSLEVFQDLTLQGPAAGKARLRQALLDHAVPPWTHAAGREKMLGEAGSDDGAIAFEREADGDLEAAGLVLFGTTDGFEVVNIVPITVSELTHRAYNAILRDFERRVASPAALLTGFEVAVTGDQLSLSDWLNPASASSLQRFSNLANKSSGASHPLDRNRWFAFLIEAHRGNTKSDPSLLRRWLVEVEGWPEEIAYDLSSEYEFARGLLGRYDSNG